MSTEIDQITKQDKKAFDKKAQFIAGRGGINLSHDAYRYLCITPRLLTVIGNLNAVDVIEEGGKDYKRLFIVVSEPLKDSYAQFRVTQTVIPHYATDLEEDKRRFIEEGFLEPEGEILTNIDMGVRVGPSLHIWGYDDHPKLRGLGLATAFYARLRECTRDLGFRFITGFNDSDRNKKFFKNMGRYSLGQLKRDKQEFFNSWDLDLDLEGSHLRAFSVDFLYPEDISEFVKV